MTNRWDEPSAPWVAAGVTLLGTFVAVVMIFPDQPSPRGALVWPGIVLSIAILFVPLMRVLRGSSKLMNAENFVAGGYLMWLLLDLVQGAYDLRDASDAAIHSALLAIGVSAAAMWVGVSGRPWRVPGWMLNVASQPLHADMVARMVPICFVLGMFNYAYSVDFDLPVMFSYVGAQRWAAPWQRGSLGGWEAFRDQMPYFGYVLPSLTALLIARRGLFSVHTVMAAVMSAIMLLFLTQGGGRRILGVTMGAALMAWVQANPSARLKNMVIVGIGGIAMAAAAQFMLNIRTTGYETFLERGSEYDYLHIDDNFLRLAQIIERVPAERPYVRAQQVVFTLVRPVPRVLWPGKPVTPGFDLAAEVGLKGLSLSSSILGEWYLSFGWAALIFGGWFHGRLAATANSLREANAAGGNPVVYALAVMVLVSGMRSMQDLVIMSYALVAWWGINRLVAPRTAAVA